MIPAGADPTGDRTTLDDLFRRAGVRHSGAPALADPPNRAAFTDGAPRVLTYAQADRAISAMAAKLRGLSLPADAVVALQLPNTVEAVIGLLGVLRAGMIAAPLPLLWRRREIVEALGRVSAKAIVTCARVGAAAHTDIAMQAAAALFPIRHVGAFGDDLPDGVAPLDGIFAQSQPPAAHPYVRTGNPAAHVAVMTFDTVAYGIEPVARTHAQLIAAGLAVSTAGAVPNDARILSTIPPGSFAGIAVTVLPWLLSGGALSLHHAFHPQTFAAQCRAQDAVVLPGPMLDPLEQAGHLGGHLRSILSVWRAPPPAGLAWRGEAQLADVTGFDETALHTAPRNGGPRPFARNDAASPGLLRIGGYRMRQSDLEADVAAVDPGATIVALPDALLGQRLAGAAADREAVHDDLQTRSVNPLIAGAFYRRARADAA